MATSLSPPLKIVIIGAGIGGLAAARALRGDGHEIILLEQSLLLREIGAAISIAPNANRILRGWGTGPRMGSPVELRGFRRVSSEVKVEVVKEVDGEKEYGVPFDAFHRVDLHTEVRRLATSDDPSLPGKPATLRTGIKIVDIDVEAGKVHLEDGEVITGDVIVGADGIRSFVRGFVVGHHVDAHLTGNTMFRSLIPKAAFDGADPELAKLVLEPYMTLWVHTNDRRMITYPCRDNELLNVAAIINDPTVPATPTFAYEGVGDLEELRGYYKGASAPISLMMSLLPSAGVWQLRTLDPLDTWVKGRTILIGDAAHAMLPFQGQGGCQAIEDAEALGAYFASITSSSSSSEIHSTLLKVHAVRFERATRNQAFSLSAASRLREGKVFTDVDSGPTANTAAVADAFSEYNHGYKGAKDWAERYGMELPA